MLMGRSHVMLLLYIGCLAAHLQSCSISCSRAAPPPTPRQKPSTGSCSTAVKRRMSLHVLSSAAFDERP